MLFKIWRRFKKHELGYLSALVLIILLSGTLFYHSVEGWTYLDSIYFCVITLATVGYGDFHPATDLGKIFTIFYIFIGIGVILGFVDLVASHTRENTEKLLKNS